MAQRIATSSHTCAISHVNGSSLDNDYIWLRVLGLPRARHQLYISHRPIYSNRMALSLWQRVPVTAAQRFLVLYCSFALEKLAALKLEVEEISLTSASQRRKLGVILEAANQSLQVEEQQAKWSMEGTWG